MSMKTEIELAKMIFALDSKLTEIKQLFTAILGKKLKQHNLAGYAESKGQGRFPATYLN